MNLLRPDRFLSDNDRTEFLNLSNCVQRASDRFLREDYYARSTKKESLIPKKGSEMFDKV